jgi:hypothetical protein
MEDLLAENKYLRTMANVPENYGINIEEVKEIFSSVCVEMFFRSNSVRRRSSRITRLRCAIWREKLRILRRKERD